MLHHCQFIRKALLAPLAISHASIARTNEFGIMQCPNHLCPVFMRQLSNQRRKLRMDIIQMHHIRLEVIQQLRELALHFPITKRTGKSHQFAHILWKVFLPRRIQILRIVHGKNRYLMPIGLQQLFQIEHINTITATAVIKLIC